MLQNWASDQYPMGQFVYHTYNETDFDLFFNATLPNSKFFFLGIGKPNMSKNAAPESKYWATDLNSVFTDPGKCSPFLASLLSYTYKFWP